MQAVAWSGVQAGQLSMATRGEIRRSGRERSPGLRPESVPSRDRQAEPDAGLDQGRDEGLSQGGNQSLTRALVKVLVRERSRVPHAAGLATFLAEQLARRARVVPARIPPPIRRLGCGGGSGARKTAEVRMTNVERLNGRESEKSGQRESVWTKG